MTTSDCPFCDIATGHGPAHMIDTWPDTIAFTPTNGGVTPGHTLVVPRAHVTNAITDPVITGNSAIRAATLASQMITAGQIPGANLITSIGPAATQSVLHLHWHIIPRRDGDGLHLPWTPPPAKPMTAPFPQPRPTTPQHPAT